MNYVILAIASLTLTSQNICQRKYNDHSGVGAFLFSGMISFFAMMFFIAVNRDWSYSAELLIPSSLFALFYSGAMLFMVLGIKYGSLAKTSLIGSCSLLLPSLYGIIMLGDPISPTLIIGTVFLLAALVMVNYQKSSSEEKISVKWIICVTLLFICNGMCTIVQKSKQIIYGEASNNVFMIVALAMVTVIMLILSLVFKDERRKTKISLRYGWLWAIFCGLANGITNFLIIYLNPRIPASVMFPVISGVGMTLIFLYSLFIRREKFNARQTVGFFVGIASIILLNL